jgi:hypothetical protein
MPWSISLLWSAPKPNVWTFMGATPAALGPEEPSIELSACRSCAWSRMPSFAWPSVKRKTERIVEGLPAPGAGPPAVRISLSESLSRAAAAARCAAVVGLSWCVMPCTHCTCCARSRLLAGQSKLIVISREQSWPGLTCTACAAVRHRWHALTWKRPPERLVMVPAWMVLTEAVIASLLLAVTLSRGWSTVTCTPFAHMHGLVYPGQAVWQSHNEHIKSINIFCSSMSGDSRAPAFARAGPGTVCEPDWSVNFVQCASSALCKQRAKAQDVSSEPDSNSY